MSISIPVSEAKLLSENNVISYRYMTTTRDSQVYSLIDKHVIPVGEVKKGQSIRVHLVATGYYEFKFGNDTGFIDKKHLEESDKVKQVSVESHDLNTALPAQNILTPREINIYLAANSKSEIFGTLANNLRYPIIGKLQDSSNNSWYQINIGERLGYINCHDVEIDHGIAVLTYHHLLKNGENKYFLHTSTTTSDIAFSNQMAYLKQAGFSTITLQQLEGYLNNKINLPAKVVVLTFDDGLKSVFLYAYPILKKYGFCATAFIISSRIKNYPQRWNPDALQFMSISELQQIQDVFDIQSHTHFLHHIDNHHHPILLDSAYSTILLDFKRSYRVLSQFNPNVIYLSYPFGNFNSKALQAVKDADFHMAVTTRQGKVKLGDNPYTLKRLYILRTDSISTMAEMLANQPESGK